MPKPTARSASPPTGRRRADAPPAAPPRSKQRARLAITVAPLTPSTWGDLVTLFERPGGAQVRGCWCMFYRRSGASDRPEGVAPSAYNRAALEALVDAGTVPGLIGYVGGLPRAWISLGPRADFAKLARSPVMKPVDDAPVWSIVCFYVDPQIRGRGAAAALLTAALRWARACGGRLVEAYPIDRATRARDDSMWFGSKGMYDAAGFVEVARRKPTRPIMRKKLAASHELLASDETT